MARALKLAKFVAIALLLALFALELVVAVGGTFSEHSLPTEWQQFRR